VTLRQQLEQWQARWAERQGLSFRPRNATSPSRAVFRLSDQFVEPLDAATENEFVRGSGGELTGQGSAGHLYSLLSSAALAVNVFAHWRFRPKRELMRALGFEIDHPVWLGFECRFPIIAGYGTPPHVDVALIAEGCSPFLCAIEAKFGEPYAGMPQHGLRPGHAGHAYFGEWPNLAKLARKISPEDRIHQHLHAAQLLKHLLGLRSRAHRFTLLYLWFDVSGPAGRRHRDEAHEFTLLARRDGAGVRAMTWQELWSALCEEARDGEHREYLNYLRRRYALDRLVPRVKN
jgi:hypothetical protein